MERGLRPLSICRHLPWYLPASALCPVPSSLTSAPALLDFPVQQPLTAFRYEPQGKRAAHNLRMWYKTVLHPLPRAHSPLRPALWPLP